MFSEVCHVTPPSSRTHAIGCDERADAFDCRSHVDACSLPASLDGSGSSSSDRATSVGKSRPISAIGQRSRLCVRLRSVSCAMFRDKDRRSCPSSRRRPHRPSPIPFPRDGRPHGNRSVAFRRSHVDRARCRLYATAASSDAADEPKKYAGLTLLTWKKVLALGFMFFCILFNYTILRDTKDVLVVTAPGSGAEIIPFLKTWVNLPMAIGFTILYAKVEISWLLTDRAIACL